MSKEERRTTLAVSRRRYAELKGKKARSRFLDEYCAVTGHGRKHAIAALNARRPGASRRRGRPSGFGAQSVKLLAKIWKLAGRPCGKLLHPVAGLYVASLRRHGGVDEGAAAEVSRMSASTMDRRLGYSRPPGGRGRGRTDSLGEHRRKIGLKTDVWPATSRQTPGWVELDTVAHCGGSMAGSFMWTLNCCDVATQWLEMRPAWNKGAHAVGGAMRESFAAIPTPILGANTDNGPEFLNAHLEREFPSLCPGAVRSRSRPYIKNDNPHVEQKNGHAVRRILGHGRIDRPEAFDAMRELLAAESLFRNLYRPTLKLLERRREGSRRIKRFEKTPKTPAQRMLDGDAVPEAGKGRVRDLLASNDPVTLRARIDAAGARLARILCQPLPPTPPPNPPRRPPAATSRRSDELLAAHSRDGAAAGGFAKITVR